MNSLLIYHLGLSLPKTAWISTTLLWELSILFGAISTLYVLLIFVLRSRIAGRRHQIEVQKQELAPRVSHFLFFPQAAEAEGQEEDLRRKQEFRKLMETPLNREVLSEILHELSQDVSGVARKRLLALYQELGLQEEAYKKLQSRKWETISKGILELSDMQVDQAYFIIRKFIHHRHSILRKQAELAIISLTDAGIQSFLDASSHPISEWQQLRVIEILKRKESFQPPDFSHWLASENPDVVLLSLRLIRHFRQEGAIMRIMGLLSHESGEIRMASLECLRDFSYAPAKETLKQCFPGETPQIKLGILDALHPILTAEDSSWLETLDSEDMDFVVRNKARAMLNSLLGTECSPPEAFRMSPQSNVESEKVEMEAEVEQGPAQRTAEEEAYALLLDMLKPDFSNLEEDEVKIEIQPTPEHFPEEPWGIEEALVFEACLLQELEDICAATPGLEVPNTITPGFLPLVDQPLNPTNMNPHEPSPEWLLRIEVQAEILFSDSGHAKVLREILLEGLEETQHVLSANFVPWVTREASAEDTDEALSEETEALLGLFPDFEVLAEEIHEIHPNEQLNTMKRPEDPTTASNPLPDYFSIFHEFFRTYDTESKLILMDEIPEIGGEKELRFLSELFEDPNPRIRSKARKAHKLLMNRLGLTAEDLQGPLGSLWMPEQVPADSARETTAAPPEESEEDQMTEAVEDIGFEPEFEGTDALGSPATTPQKTRTQSGYLRLLKYLNGSQNETDA